MKIEAKRGIVEYLRVGLIKSNPDMTCPEINRAMWYLRRSNRLGDALRSQEWEELKKEMEGKTGITRGDDMCLDDRNIVSLHNNEADVSKEPAAVIPVTTTTVDLGHFSTKTRKNFLEGGCFVFKRDGDRAALLIPDSAVLAEKLRLAASDPKRRPHLRRVKAHTDISGGQLCGAMEKYKKEKVEGYDSFETLEEWNLALLQKTIEAEQNAFNLRRIYLGEEPQSVVGIKVLFDHCTYGPILKFNPQRPRDSFTMADLERAVRSRVASKLRKEVGDPGSLRGNFIHHSDPMGIIELTRKRFVGAVALMEDKEFRDFQLNIYDWVDRTGLTDLKQREGLSLAMAEDAMLQYLLGTSDKPLDMLAKHNSRDIFVSNWGVTLDQRDPFINRFAGTPASPERMPEQIKIMWSVIDLHEESGMSGPSTRHSADSRLIFLSAPTDVNHTDNPGLATTYARIDLSESIKAINADPFLSELKRSGKARFIPVIVNNTTAEALKVPNILG